MFGLEPNYTIDRRMSAQEWPIITILRPGWWHRKLQCQGLLVNYFRIKRGRSISSHKKQQEAARSNKPPPKKQLAARKTRITLPAAAHCTRPTPIEAQERERTRAHPQTGERTGGAGKNKHSAPWSTTSIILILSHSPQYPHSHHTTTTTNTPFALALSVLFFAAQPILHVTERRGYLSSRLAKSPSYPLFARGALFAFQQRQTMAGFFRRIYDWLLRLFW